MSKQTKKTDKIEFKCDGGDVYINGKLYGSIEYGDNIRFRAPRGKKQDFIEIPCLLRVKKSDYYFTDKHGRKKPYRSLVYAYLTAPDVPYEEP